MRSYILVLLVCISLFSLTSSRGWGGGSHSGGGWGGGSKTSSSGGWGGASKTGSSPSDGSDTGSSSKRGSGSKTGTSSRGWGGGRRSGGWRGGSRSGGWGGSRKRGGGSFGSNGHTKTIMGAGIGAFAGYQLGKASSHFLYGGRPYYYGDRYYNTPPGYIRCNYSLAGNSQFSQFRYDDRGNEPITQLVFSCPRNFRCCDADCCPRFTRGYGRAELEVAEVDKEANFSGVVMAGGEGNETSENSTEQAHFISRLRKELAVAETDKEAMKQQPKSLQDEIDRLLLIRIQAYCSAFMAGGEIAENSTEQEKLISKLRKELAFSETDKESMKRQLKSQQDEYDRLMGELEKVQYYREMEKLINQSISTNEME